jgi:hypothetical protein
MMVKLRRIKGIRHVACVGVMRNAYEVLVRKLKKSDHLEYLCINGVVSLKEIGMVWIGLIGVMVWTGL